MNVKAVVLESVKGTSAKGRAYNIAVVRLTDTGKVMKIFSDVDLTPFIDKDTELVLKVTADRELKASVSVESAEEA